MKLLEVRPPGRQWREVEGGVGACWLRLRAQPVLLYSRQCDTLHSSVAMRAAAEGSGEDGGEAGQADDPSFYQRREGEGSRQYAERVFRCGLLPALIGGLPMPCSKRCSKYTCFPCRQPASVCDSMAFFRLHAGSCTPPRLRSCGAWRTCGTAGGRLRRSTWMLFCCTRLMAAVAAQSRPPRAAPARHWASVMHISCGMCGRTLACFWRQCKHFLTSGRTSWARPR